MAARPLRNTFLILVKVCCSFECRRGANEPPGVVVGSLHDSSTDKGSSYDASRGESPVPLSCSFFPVTSLLSHISIEGAVRVLRIVQA